MEQQENNYPVPDFKKVKFIIEIKVCENANTIKIKSPDKEDEKFKWTYQEAVGALEICKHRLMNDWSKHNEAEHEKQKSESQPK